jgi:hypothetical protein
MKIIVAGSRSITDYSFVCRAIEASGFDVTEVVSGHAGKTLVRGEWKPSVDRLGEQWSREFLGKEPKLFPADWVKYGKRAGFIRNKDMAVYADGLIACWDGKSPGTIHMMDCARKKQMPMFVMRYEP